MAEVPVRARDGVSGDDLARLAGAVRSHGSLQRVLAWCAAQRPPVRIAEFLAQDEYTHDVVVPLGGGLHAVYDTT